MPSYRHQAFLLSCLLNQNQVIYTTSPIQSMNDVSLTLSGQVKPSSPEGLCEQMFVRSVCHNMHASSTVERSATNDAPRHTPPDMKLVSDSSTFLLGRKRVFVSRKRADAVSLTCQPCALTVPRGNEEQFRKVLISTVWFLDSDLDPLKNTIPKETSVYRF